MTPAFDYSGAFKDNAGAGSGRIIVRSDGLEMELELKKNVKKKKKKKNKSNELGLSGTELASESGRTSSNGGASESVSFRLGNLHKYVEGEQVAAGWPAWLSAVAGEAIQGWVPLKADAFEKLEKVDNYIYCIF